MSAIGNGVDVGGARSVAVMVEVMVCVCRVHLQLRAGKNSPP